MKSITKNISLFSALMFLSTLAWAEEIPKEKLPSVFYEIEKNSKHLNCKQPGARIPEFSAKQLDFDTLFPIDAEGIKVSAKADGEDIVLQRSSGTTYRVNLLDAVVRVDSSGTSVVLIELKETEIKKYQVNVGTIARPRYETREEVKLVATVTCQ